MKSTHSIVLNKTETHIRNKKPETLLEMALAHEKRSWLPGEKILLWRGVDPTKRAYLIERGGAVYLILMPFGDLPCVVFQEDPLTSFWDVAEDLSNEYQSWKERVKARIRVASKNSQKDLTQNKTESGVKNRLINNSYDLRRRGAHAIQIAYKKVESRAASQTR